MPRKSTTPKKSNLSPKHAVPGKVPPQINPRDTFRVGNTWMIRLANGKHVRVPMLHEEFPGGKEVSQRLLSASTRAREIIQGANRKPVLSPNEILGMETERAHFRFNQIIKESRALRDKGLVAQSRDNLVHARKLLDDINGEREKLRLPPLTPREFMSFQRPLSAEESLQLLLKGGISERVKQIMIVVEAELKKSKQLKNTPQTTTEQLSELPERLAKLPAATRKDMLALLQIAKKGLKLEREMRKKGKMMQARAALKVYDDALRTFGEILPK